MKKMPLGTLTVIFLPFFAPLLFNSNTNLCILVWKIVKQGENSRRQDSVKTTSLEGFRVIRTVAKIYPIISVNVRPLVQEKQQWLKKNILINLQNDVQYVMLLMFFFLLNLTSLVKINHIIIFVVEKMFLFSVHTWIVWIELNKIIKKNILFRIKCFLLCSLFQK